MSKATDTARRLRTLGDLGTTNYKADRALCYQAADMLEDMEERIDIMLEGNKITQMPAQERMKFRNGGNLE